MKMKKKFSLSSRALPIWPGKDTQRLEEGLCYAGTPESVLKEMTLDQDPIDGLLP